MFPSLQQHMSVVARCTFCRIYSLFATNRHNNANDQLTASGTSIAAAAADELPLQQVDVCLRLITFSFVAVSLLAGRASSAADQVMVKNFQVRHSAVETIMEYAA